MSLCRLAALLRRLPADRRGSAATEFALIAPVFIITTVALIELALVMFINFTIEAAVRDGARYGITGNSPGGVSREQQLRNIIADRTVGLVDMSTIQISAKVYPSFASVGQPEAYDDANANGQWDAGETFDDVNGNNVRDGDPGVPGMGNSGEIVLYTIAYGMPLIAPITRQLLGTDAVTLATRLVVRNEPWNPQ